MTFVVTELTDPMPVVTSLESLSRVNSPNLDLSAEARLAHARFWTVATHESEVPIAYALVWLIGDELEIVDVATAEHARRQGAAKSLLETLLGQYQARGREAAFLEVRANNHPATNLYLKLGFERTRVRRRYYSDGEDAWDMRLGLTARNAGEHP